MTLIELIVPLFLIGGAILGMNYHALLHTGPVLGAFFGALAGVCTACGLLLFVAAICAIVTGRPMFGPAKKDADGV